MTTATLRRRRGSPGSPATAPLDDDDLLSEILLRLPPHPSSLPRASAVCKHWLHLVSESSFLRRFRRHHRRNPPLLGFFHGYIDEGFVPTLEPPNRVAPGRFSLQQRDHGDRLLILGCRQGLVLMLDRKREKVMVWEPVTGDQHSFAVPTGFDPYETEIRGAVLRAAAGDAHFQVVLVVTGNGNEDERVVACVYSSETGLWGNLISTQLPCTSLVSDIPAVLVGDSLYWTVCGDFAEILEFDLERQSLTVIQVPVDLSEDEYDLVVTRAEGGGLGFLLVSELDLSAQLWKRKADYDGVASWELRRTIELDKLLSLNSREERECIRIRGLAECNNVLFLWTVIGLFMVDLESQQFKKLIETANMCHPFEDVYAAGNTMP